MAGTLPTTPTLHALPRAFRAAAWCAVALTLCLVVMGGLVTSYEVGLSVPDATTTMGDPLVLASQADLTPDQRIEHTHRLLGMMVGCATLLLAVTGLAGAWYGHCSRRVGIWSGIALSAVVLQGLMGMLRVAEQSDAWAMVHAGFAQLVFALLAGLAVVSLVRYSRLQARVDDAPPWRLAVITAVIVYGQIVLGIVTRHGGPMGDGGAANLHLLNAGLVLILCGTLAAKASALPAMRGLGGSLLALLVAQIALGFAAWGAAYTVDAAAGRTGFAVAVATAHVAVGALLLANTVAMALVGRRLGHTQQVRLADGPTPVPYVPASSPARVLA